MIDIRNRIIQLIKKHGGVNSAATKVKVDPAYFVRLRDGERNNPGDETLAKLGLKKVVTYRLLSTSDNKKT